MSWILQLFRNKNEKYTVFAFSPKASKSGVEQAGLLTYPLCNAFPRRLNQHSGSLLQSCKGITAAGTVQECRLLTGSPVSLLILK